MIHYYQTIISHTYNNTFKDVSDKADSCRAYHCLRWLSGNFEPDAVSNGLLYKLGYTEGEARGDESAQQEQAARRTGPVIARGVSRRTCQRGQGTRSGSVTQLAALPAARSETE